jgi:purine-binding chemotaxis protein CheW
VPFSDHAPQLVVFSLGGERYALPIVRLLEVVSHAELHRLPFADPSIEGVVGFRGELLPVCDLARRLQVSAPRADEAVIVTAETSTGAVGIVVDGLEDVLPVADSGLEWVPVADTDLVHAIGKLDGRLLVLLDPGSLFTAPRVGASAAAA